MTLLPFISFVALMAILVIFATFPNQRGVYRAPRCVPVRLVVQWLVLTNNIRQDTYATAWCARLALRYARRRWFEQRNR